jgi:S1-C subfamily serine protease
MTMRMGMTRSAALQAALAIGLLAAGGAWAATPAEIYKQVSPSVWRVFSYDADGKPISQGSAVVIAAETLLTNCHVLAKGKSYSIRQDNTMLGAKLQHADIDRDMCQLTVRGLKAPAVQIGDSDKLVVGQRIYTLGNPLGQELTLSDGLVSALRMDNQQHLGLIQISAPISPGSSGGGLFDESGALVGITSAGFEKAQNVNLAIPIKWLQELVERSRAALARYKAAEKTQASAPRAAPPVAQVPPPAAPAPAAPTPPAAVARIIPVASGFADIGDVEKLNKLVLSNPRAKAAYEDFLTRPLPRAFAVTAAGGSYESWGLKPKNPASNPDPAQRIIGDCENYHQRQCVLYAIDNVVVYQPKQDVKTAAQQQATKEQK